MSGQKVVNHMKGRRQKTTTSNQIFGIREKILVFSITATTLAVTPDLTMDPITLPKFTIMVILAGFLVPNLRYLKKKFSLPKSRSFLFILAFFLVAQTGALIFSGASLSSQLYGAPGRLTGLITYFTLSIYFIYSTESEHEFLTLKLLKVLVTLGAILSIYGFLQSLGIEFFSYGLAYGSPVFGTLGNSNFLSAFLGISASATLIKFFDRHLSTLQKSVYLTSTLFSLLTIFRSNSQQGFLVFAAGLSFAVTIYFYINRNFRTRSTGITLFILSGVVTAAGVFNRGPLASYIFDSSLSIRQGYWRSAVSMLSNHPYSGIGIDNYLNWYRRSRAQEISAKSPDSVSDSAHNVFLDIGSGSGVLALLAYLILTVFVFRAILKVVSRAKSLDFTFIAIAAAWFAYQIQSLISINQLALALWGWVLGGIIVGYEIRTSSQSGKKLIPVPEVELQDSKRLKFGLGTLSYVVVVSLIATLPFVSSTRFLSTLKSGNPEAIKASAYFFPRDYSRFIYVATALRVNKFDAEALEVIKDAAEEFPDTFEVWSLYSSLPTASAIEIARAKAEMKRLDPYNPNLK
jgi:O-antigen ligase